MLLDFVIMAHNNFVIRSEYNDMWLTTKGTGGQIVLKTSGNVGIGTVEPSAGGEQDLKLDVHGAVGADYYCDKDGNNCVSSSGLGGGSGQTMFSLENDLGDIDFYSSNTSNVNEIKELLNITGSGYLLEGAMLGHCFSRIQIIIDGVTNNLPISLYEVEHLGAHNDDDVHFTSLPPVKFDQSLVIKYTHCSKAQGDIAGGHAWVKMN